MQTYLEKIHKLQKWAVRIISNSYYRSHSAPLFQKHDILNVYDSYKLEFGVFMYKYFNGLLPMSFNAFSPKFLIFIIMTQETNQIIIQLG